MKLFSQELYQTTKPLSIYQAALFTEVGFCNRIILNQNGIAILILGADKQPEPHKPDGELHRDHYKL